MNSQRISKASRKSLLQRRYLLPRSYIYISTDRTYDEYTSELSSGHLSWTPVHESDDFWKENATKLNDKDREQLKCVKQQYHPYDSKSTSNFRILVKLLIDSSDPLVLAVAAHDIGQYVKHYERGKK